MTSFSACFLALLKSPTVGVSHTPPVHPDTKQGAKPPRIQVINTTALGTKIGHGIVEYKHSFTNPSTQLHQNFMSESSWCFFDVCLNQS